MLIRLFLCNVHSTGDPETFPHPCAVANPNMKRPTLLHKEKVNPEEYIRTTM